MLIELHVEMEGEGIKVEDSEDCRDFRNSVVSIAESERVL